MLSVEILRAAEDTGERILEGTAGFPANHELFLEAGERLVHVPAERVHVRHGKGPEALETDAFSFLLVPEGVGGKLIHLHRERVRGDVHVVHNREHAKARRKPEHHTAVTGAEAVLTFAELSGVLVDGSVAEIIHDRGLDRHTAVVEHQSEHVVGEQVPNQLATGHPAVMTNIRERFVVHQFLAAHQFDMQGFAAGLSPKADFLADEASEDTGVGIICCIVTDSVRSEHEELVGDLFFGLLCILFVAAGNNGP